MSQVALTVSLEAGHRDIAGRPHGHSYVVEVWFHEGFDLGAMQVFLKNTAGAIDHTMLEDSIGSPKMEDLARWFLTQLPTAVEVIVHRPTLGFKARVIR